MKKYSTFHPVMKCASLTAALCILLPAARSAMAAEAAATAGDSTEYSELYELSTLSEIARHLYRWNLDERDFEGIGSLEFLEFNINPVHPNLDEGDRSLYAEVMIPALSTVVLMKKTDYTIEELDLEVKSDRFKIINVEKRLSFDQSDSSEATVQYPVRQMLEYLFETRAQSDFPSKELSARLGDALRESIAEADMRDEGIQTFFVAPLSPVANEIWAFWENRKLLIRWASDIELSNPAVWDHESLAVKVFDIEQQVVIAFSEAPGSNAYLTRDQVGRVMYNCIILGQKRVIEPEARQE